MSRPVLEENELATLLRVEQKKGRVSLGDVTERLRARNLDMASYLKSIGVALPEYYANLPERRR